MIEDQVVGNKFNRTDINFIYSFYWDINNFDSLKKAILCVIKPKWKEIEEKTKNIHTYVNLQDEIIHEFEDSVRYWSLGIHHSRIGLASRLRFSIPSLTTSNENSSNEISCFIKHHGPIQIRSVTKNEELDCDDLDKCLDAYPKDCTVLFQLFDTGQGCITFQFQLDTKFHLEQLSKSGVQVTNDDSSMLPYIFSILTLGRIEDDLRGEAVPKSRIAFKPDGTDRYKQFISLHQLCNDFLFDELPQVFSVIGKADMNVNSLDNYLITKISEDNKQGEKNAWQAPYVSIFCDLDPEISIPKNSQKAWWFTPCDRFSASRDAHIFPLNKVNYKIDIQQCYRETILLLLRLYQWREVLDINEWLSSSRKYVPKPRWENILILPDLLEEVPDENGFSKHLFSDIDLVWDTRYLMLFHERSTVVFNVVPCHSNDDGRIQNDFKIRLHKSLLKTLEHIRCNWHSAVVLALSLDALVIRLSAEFTDANRLSIIEDIAKARIRYAKLLRDNSVSGTDAAALGDLKRRAYEMYSMDRLFETLRDKFQAIDDLIADFSLISNLKSYNKNLQSDL